MGFREYVRGEERRGGAVSVIVDGWGEVSVVERERGM
jgi:hypothetical protein